MRTRSTPDDAVFEERGVKIVVDSASLPLIDGTVVDFVKQGLNEAFKFQNPKAKGRVRLRGELQRLGAAAARAPPCDCGFSK